MNRILISLLFVFLITGLWANHMDRLCTITSGKNGCESYNPLASLDWNGDGYDWDDHFNPISDKKDEFKEIHAEFKDISFYSKHEDEEDFSDSVIAEKLKNAKIEEIHTYADFIGKENDIKLVLKQITFHFSNSSDYQFPINEDYKVFID